MKVSELQTALKAKEASTFAAQGAVRRLGKAEEKAKMRVVSLALQQPRWPPRCCPRCCDGARRRPE